MSNSALKRESFVSRVSSTMAPATREEILLLRDEIDKISRNVSYESEQEVKDLLEELNYTSKISF